MAKRKKSIDIGGKTKINPLAIRVLFTGINFIILILGLNLLLGMGLIDWITSVFALIFALFGAIQIGLKRYTTLSSLKRFGLLEWIGTFTVLILLAFSILNFFNLLHIPALNQIAGAIFVGGAVVTTFDIWI